MGLSHPAGFVFFLSLFRVLSSVWIARDMRSQSVMQKPRHRKVSGFLFSDGRRTGRTAVIDVCGCCGRCFGRTAGRISGR